MRVPTVVLRTLPYQPAACDYPPLESARLAVLPYVSNAYYDYRISYILKTLAVLIVEQDSCA